MQIFEVGQVTGYIKQVMDYDELLADLWVHGEVSNFSRSPAGHIYFSLKDGQSQLRCAFFRNSQRRVGVELSNGLAILVHGRVSFYEAQGSCQLYADAVQPEGVGLLYLQFEALRARLEAEGLFAQERKRALPTYPRRIGLVTSLTGAVIHDFITIIERRYPLVEILVAPSSVQGDSAPAEIIAALSRLNDYHQTREPLDLIVIARGGGSMEDLAAFNHEGLARAIFASSVPVVSAIGHETDYTIADFVADLRAPTPSAAAELVTPNVIDCRMELAEMRRRMIRGMQDLLLASSSALTQTRHRIERHSPSSQIDTRRRGVDELLARGHRSMLARLQFSREQVNGSILQLEALSPLQTLSRGYSICRDRATGTLIRSYQAVEPGDRLEIRVADGVVESTATVTTPSTPIHE
ncbi:MAG TPA: exodeoxyribonuclease VII large subunit [Chloroflexota bacterium]|nr:exodeoxyribonuclease VII large subunit [Chloroflexota bacterium]